MSLRDPFEVKYQPKRSTFIVVRGDETFYDDDRYLIEFDSLEEAQAWTRDRFDVTPKLRGEDVQLSLFPTMLPTLPSGRKDGDR